MRNLRRAAELLRRSVGFTLPILVALTASSASQDASAGRFATFKQLLRERKIPLTEEGLTAGLRNPDAHVRYLAALVLAEDKTASAVPAIESALMIEKVPETRVNIALALAKFGDKNGFSVLRESCDDAELAPHLKVYAAKYLLDLHDKGCLSSIEGVVQSSPDAGARVLALSQLPRFQEVSAADLERILGIAIEALSDQNPTVRIAASHALVELGNSSAVSPLEKEIASEHEEGVRSIMRADLRRLQEKAGH